jgi:predicted nucleotidyltransferase
MERAIQIIRETIENKELEVLKITLFGSRTKDTAREDSDWDFFDKLLLRN